MFGTLYDRLSGDETWTYLPCHTCGKHVREVGLERIVITEDSTSRTCIDICPLCLADPRNIQGYVAEHVIKAIESHEWGATSP